MRVSAAGSRDSLCCGVVGLDHNFFDELVRIKALAAADADDFAVFEDDPVLWSIDLQRLALLAPAPRAGVRLPERFQDWLEQWSGLFVGLAVDGRLRLLV